MNGFNAFTLSLLKYCEALKFKANGESFNIKAFSNFFLN